MQVKIENGRLAFLHVFQAQDRIHDDGTKSKSFGLTVLIGPDHPAVALIKAAQRAVALDPSAWGPEKGEEMLRALAAKDRTALHDGAEKAIKYDGFSGMLYISANSKIRPPVFHPNEIDPTTKQLRLVREEEGLVYAGCYGNVMVDIYAQKDHPKGGNRINTQLMGLQYVGKGDAFGGGKVADASAFSSIASDTGSNDPWANKKTANSDLV